MDIKVGYWSKLVEYYPSEYSGCNFSDYNTMGRCRAGRYLYHFIQLMQLKRPISMVPVSDLIPSGNSTDRSLFGQLSRNQLDMYAGLVTITEKRQTYVTYASPPYFERLCFYTLRSDNSTNIVGNDWFFIDVFHIYIWLLVGLLIFAVSILQVYIAMRSMDEGAKITNSYAPSILILGVLCYGYLVSIKANTLNGMTIRPPFATVDELAFRIFHNQSRLVTSSVEDYRFELINNSKISGIMKLKKALTYNPPVMTSSYRKSCEILEHDQKLVWLDLEIGAMEVCDLSVFPQLYQICPTEMPSTYASYVFPKRSKLAERMSRVTEFIYVYITAETRFISQLQQFRRLQYMDFSKTVDMDVKSLTTLFKVLFLSYGVGLLLCMTEVMWKFSSKFVYPQDKYLLFNISPVKKISNVVGVSCCPLIVK